MPDERLTLPWPPSVNNYWRQFKGRLIISADGRRYRDLVLASFVGRTPIAERIAVTMFAFPPDRRRRDLDNALKAPLDALTHARVWEDDSLIDLLLIERGEVVRGGRLEVSISVLTEEMKARISAALAPMRAVCDRGSARVFADDAAVCGKCAMWSDSWKTFPYGSCWRGEGLATDRACDRFVRKGNGS